MPFLSPSLTIDTNPRRQIQTKPTQSKYKQKQKQEEEEKKLKEWQSLATNLVVAKGYNSH